MRGLQRLGTRHVLHSLSRLAAHGRQEARAVERELELDADLGDRGAPQGTARGGRGVGKPTRAPPTRGYGAAASTRHALRSSPGGPQIGLQRLSQQRATRGYRPPRSARSSRSGCAYVEGSETPERDEHTNRPRTLKWRLSVSVTTGRTGPAIWRTLSASPEVPPATSRSTWALRPHAGSTCGCQNAASPSKRPTSF